MITHLYTGSWREGRGEELVARDPATGATVWRGAAASLADVDDACRTARSAYASWSQRPLAERIALVRRFAEVVDSRRSVLAERISREVGKPRWEAEAEVRAMIAKVEISIEAQARRASEFRNGPAVTRFRPHGVVAVLGPFNFPGHLPNGHIVPALLAGNAAVFKPSERTPGVGALTVECWEAAGSPPGVVNLVQGGGETGAALARNDAIDGVFFTGSVRVGHALHRELAGRPEKILALEMGGNNPLVVWNVRDTDAAVIAVVQSAYITSGQRCTCARRLIVEDGAAGEQLVARVAAAARRLRIGPFTDEPEPFMGPVIGPDAATALAAAQADLIARGAEPIVELVHRSPATGFVSPGLLDVTRVNDRPDEELFGPLLQVIRVPDFASALAEANHTAFGLAAGLLGDDPALWEQFRVKVRAGVVNWNRELTGASSAVPFGGVGKSGNHRPSAYFTADYASYPVSSIEVESLSVPATLPPGLSLRDP